MSVHFYIRGVPRNDQIRYYGTLTRNQIGIELTPPLQNELGEVFRSMRILNLGIIEITVTPGFQVTINLISAVYNGQRIHSTNPVQISFNTANDLFIRIYRDVVESAEEPSPILSQNVVEYDSLRLQYDQLLLTLQTLIKQLYGLPIDMPSYLFVNELPTNFITLEQAGKMLSENQIERTAIDSLLQPWAGHPGSPNKIITLIARDGRLYLVKCRYDSITNQLFPPV